MKRKRKGAFNKSSGITYDTAAFALAFKIYEKSEAAPNWNQGSSYHYLMREMGLEPTRPYSH